MKTPAWMAKLARPVSLWRTALGWACVCAGIIGILLPVIPGVPLLLAGLVIFLPDTDGLLWACGGSGAR